MPMISAFTTIAGTIVSAAGAAAQGKAAQQAAEYEAKQMEMKAKEEQALAQREGEEQKRKKDLAQSRLQAVSAASGFTATDPTSLQIGEEIEEYGTLQQQMADFGGAARRGDLEAQAASRRYEGQVAKMNANYSAAGTILGGVTSLASRFAPRTTTASSYRYG